MNRLPILMYHDVTTNESESINLTISLSKLEKQFEYLKKRNYTTLHFSELKAEKLPKKSVILTFDDIYKSQLMYVYPLLKKFGFKACFFIPFKFVNKTDKWKTSSKNIMSVKDLKSLDSNIIELGQHSFNHKKFHEIPLEDIDADFKEVNAYIEAHSLNICPVLAYPYGKYPREEDAYKKFVAILKKHNIKYALRIGNRINKYPFKDKYQVNRIDIKGEDSILIFALKLKLGKLKF